MPQPEKAAQIGNGAVLAHPGFRKMPECKMPLQTEKARREYGGVARKLFDAGKLTEARHIAASGYAWIIDQIELAAAAGRPGRASWVTQMRGYLKDLDLDGIDRPVAAPISAPTNKFARRGIPNGRK